MTKKRSDGEGSVYYDRSRAKWVGAIVLGYRDGKPIRKKVSANTKSGASVKLLELRDRHQADELPEGKALTVEQWMRYWFTKIAPRRCGDLTLAGYSTKVNHYIIPLLGRHRLDRLTPEHIEDAWDRLADTGNPVIDDPQPLSPNTIHQTHRILARALKVAVQRKRLKANPAGGDFMDAPPLVEEEIEPISAADIEKILAAADTDPYGARWYVALSLGLRPGEALGLRWSDVDLDGGDIHIRQTLKRVKGKGLTFGTPKSAAGRRDQSIPAKTLEPLRAHKKRQAQDRLQAGSVWRDTGLVFTMEDGRPIDPSVDSRRWRALLESVGVPHQRLYNARHSAATTLLAQGVGLRAAMDFLGHSQSSMTVRYQHAVDEIKRDTAERMNRGLPG